MVHRLSALAALAVLPLALLACDSSGGGATVEADTMAEADTSTAADTSVAAQDTTPIAVDTTPAAPNYPDGPYGGEFMDTIRPDLSFYDPWTGLEHAMSDYYENPDVRILVLSSAAIWCTACEYEAWDLIDAYNKYKEDGLEILYTLYEDGYGRALWGEKDRIDDDFTAVNLWRENIGPRVGLERRETNYPVLIDIGWQLGEYYDKSATPFTVMVRTSDMKIVYRDVGYAGGTIEHHIKTAIYSN